MAVDVNAGRDEKEAHSFIGGELYSAGRRESGTLSDYFSLLKPRVMSLAVFTSLTGMVAAPGHLHPLLGVTAILLIAVGAGAAGALNMWYDADIDRLMARTARRPIVQNRVRPKEALLIGVLMSVGAVAGLGLLVIWVAAALLALTIAYYIFVYTMWLKRRTPQNIVIGGAAGAFPPMIGWAAATGGVSLDSLILFAIIFLWTPPHFWSLALVRSRDYERAGVPMLPVCCGKAVTRRQILAYSVVMVIAGSVAGDNRARWRCVSWGCGHWGRGVPSTCRSRLHDCRWPSGRQGSPAAFRLLDPVFVRAVRGAACGAQSAGGAVRAIPHRHRASSSRHYPSPPSRK